MSDESSIKVGDLIRVVGKCEPENYIFRPYGFPYNKVGLITKLEFIFDDEIRNYDIDPELYQYTYDFRTYYGELIEVLVEGKKYWVFPDEIKKVNQQED